MDIFELIGFLYFIIVYALPFTLILLVPVLYTLINFYKSQRYRRAYSRLLVTTYEIPSDLTPAEIGYLFDEKSNKNEILAEYLLSLLKTPSYDFQEKISNLSIEEIKYLKKPKFNQTDEKLNGKLNSIHSLIEKNLVKSNHIRRFTANSYYKRSGLAFKKSARISRYTTYYPQSFLIIILLLTGGLSSFDNPIIEASLLLLVFAVIHLIHSAAIYCIEMLRLHARDKGKVKLLDKNRKIKQTLWDQIRGYRHYLLKVEVGKVNSYIKMRDHTYLKSEKIPYMIALGLIDANQAFEIIRFQKAE